jgi:hypothetical protein
MSTLKVDTILKRTGTGTITLGQSGDTIALGSGASATGFGVAGTNIFKATMSSSQTSVSSGAWTKALFNTDVFDADSVFDTSNNRFIAPAAGKYFFTAKLGIYPNTANGSKVQAKYYKNGSAIANSVGSNVELAGSETIISGIYLTNSIILDLAQNDYIEYYGRFIAASGTITFDSGGSFFTGYRIA